MRFGLAVLLGITCAIPAWAQPEDESPRYGAEAGLDLPELLRDSDRGHLRLEYVWCYLRRLEVPALVTSGPIGATGALDDPRTVILRGNGALTSRHGRYIGFRGDGEYWFDDAERFGIQAGATILERDSSNLTYRHNAFNLLARPYVDAATGTPRALIIAGLDPVLGELNGSINVYSRVEFFSQDVNAMTRVWRGEFAYLNLLAGARFFQMRERLDITATSRVRPAEAILLGYADHLQTFDKFYGGQFGLAGGLRSGRWSLEGRSLLALGADDQEIRTKGDRVVHTPATRTTFPYGLYVLPSNTGNFRRAVFDWVTDWQINVGFRWSNHVRTRVGYTLLTWNNPVRPGNQIDVLNLSQVAPGGLVGPAAPTIPFRTSFFWVQGINFGLEANW